MLCKNSAFIQMYIDCELDINERKSFEVHIKTCTSCKDKFEDMKSNDDFCFEKISQFTKSIDDEISSHPSEKFNFEYKLQKNKSTNKGVYNMITKYKKQIIVASILVMAISMLSIQPVSASITKILSIFRADNVETLTLTIDDFKELKSNLEKENPEFFIDKFGKINSTGGEKLSCSADELSEKNIKMLPADSGYSINNDSYLLTKFEMKFKLNIKNINQFMSSYQANTLLPEKLDGKEFTLKIPEQINTSYLKNNATYHLLETTKPEIVSTSKVDINEIKMALLDLPFIPKNLANKLKGINDWESTLYIPVLESNSTTEIVNNNNVKFYEIDLASYNNSLNSENNFAAVWLDGDKLYNAWCDSSKEDLIEMIKLLR